MYNNPIPLGNQATGLNPVTGAVLNSASSLIGGLISGRQNKLAQERAYKQNLEQWHRANAYNHPAMQVKRMTEAGLNPAMMYKGAPQNVAVNSPQKQAPKYSIQNAPLDIMGQMGQYQAIKNQQVNMNLQRSQIRLNNAKELLTIMDRMNSVTKFKRGQIENRLLEQFGGPQAIMGLSAQESGIQTQASQRAVNKARIDLLKIQKMVDNKNWEYFDKYNIRPNDPYAFAIKQIIDYIKSGQGKKDVKTTQSYINKALEIIDQERQGQFNQGVQDRTGEIWINGKYYGRQKR